MTLSSGSRIGSYEILATLGVGGMGEVYRARDPKLNREVAIKVLLESVTSDPERVARFKREAQVLASLNHPHIAHLYGFEDSGTTSFLVMELVDGATLAELIDAGLPLDQALPIARQIAEALEAAHEQGVVHRDLKPANVKVRADGVVKVLDFGLAKALDPSGGSSVEAMNSPTLTAHATQMGVILGTAAYMSPEQAKGRSVDKRADVWAFGVVLYEMLTGDRAFKGEDISDTLAAVLRQEITLADLPATTPPRLRRLIARCIMRDPKQRLRDIGEARIELARIEVGEVDVTDASSASLVAVAAAAAPAWKRALPWSVAGLASLAMAASFVMWAPWRARDAAIPLHLSADIGFDSPIVTGVGAGAVISPDGRLVVFNALGPKGSQLFVRHLDQLEATPIAGSEGGPGNPFFSPDSEWIGFFASGKLNKISVSGGAAFSICDAPAGRGAAWADDDTIYFQPNTTPSPLMRVSAGGGPVTAVGELADGDSVARWPQLLPGGKGILYTGNNTQRSFESSRLIIQPLPSGKPKVVLSGGFYGRYVASGHLLYLHNGALFAVPFNLGRMEVSGSAVPVLDGVSSSPGTGGAQFSVSDKGSLVYLSAKGQGADRPMFWLDATGTTKPLRAAGADWLNPRFSPDGRRIAMSINSGGLGDVWIYDWARDTATKFTFDSANDGGPVWSPDGRRLAFYSDRATRGINQLYWQRADGTGDVQQLTKSPHSQQPASFHPSGKYLAFTETAQAGNGDLMILPIDGDETTGWKPGTPTVFLSTPANEQFPVFSPDGRWIAYMSDEAGQMQTYVRPFPGPGGKQLVSASGLGIYPVWSRVKHELFFLDPLVSKIMVAGYSADRDSFLSEKPRVWSAGLLPMLGTSRMFDMHPDMKRAAIGRPPEADQRGKVVFIVNFFEELRRKATGK